jgi:peptidoglycan/xylan/chitin deacetylase (PgdA/CDA1 family)
MATNPFHLKLRAGAAVFAALAVLPACAFGGHATTGTSTSESNVSSPTAEETSTTAPERAHQRARCPLRFPNPLPSRVRAVPILMYHLIGAVKASTPEITQHLTVNPVVFAHQMTWLKHTGYHTITHRQLFNALMCGSRLPRKPILVTFDDGYKNVYKNAAPILERKGMRGTAYVITGRISGDDRSFLTWKQLRLLEQMGVDVASHTVSHVGLTALSNSAALSELARSRRVLERKLGHRVPWLAYPFGDYDSRIEGLARQAGYRLATTTVPGTRQYASRPLALYRLRVLDTTGVSGLAAMLDRAS